jgi:hypothetical protein
VASTNFFDQFEDMNDALSPEAPGDLSENYEVYQTTNQLRHFTVSGEAPRQRFDSIFGQAEPIALTSKPVDLTNNPFTKNLM